jgi:NAD(P)H dehydrogenase (quinone)
MKIAIAYHSGYGHTAVLAEAVGRGAAEAGAEASLLAVDTLTESGWDALNEADAIVFGAPTYMGGPSAAFKRFADDSSRIWADFGWRDKLAAGFTCSGSMSGDKMTTLTYLALFAAQHGMQWVSLGLQPSWNSSGSGPEGLNRLGSYLGVLAQANTDEGPDVAPPISDRRTAEHLGRRVAESLARSGRSETALTGR